MFIPNMYVHRYTLHMWHMASISPPLGHLINFNKDYDEVILIKFKFIFMRLLILFYLNCALIYA